VHPAANAKPITAPITATVRRMTFLFLMNTQALS
jgi:hypothetical protein